MLAQKLSPLVNSIKSYLSVDLQPISYHPAAYKLTPVNVDVWRLCTVGQVQKSNQQAKLLVQMVSGGYTWKDLARQDMAPHPISGSLANMGLN